MTGVFRCLKLKILVEQTFVSTHSLPKRGNNRFAYIITKSLHSNGLLYLKFFSFLRVANFFSISFTLNHGRAIEVSKLELFR